MSKPSWILIMGVSGAGKTTVGQRLATSLNGTFIDADHFHSPENIEKMKNGHPLSDEDRVPWLDRIASAVKVSRGKAPIVVACSALKESYRRQLAVLPYQLVYLRGTHEQIASRLKARKGHFVSANLLSSQFAALEEPEGALLADISLPVDEIVAFVIANLSPNFLGDKD